MWGTEGSAETVDQHNCRVRLLCTGDLPPPADACNVHGFTGLCDG